MFDTDLTFVICLLTQVSLLLFFANWLVHMLWRRGCDPDNHSIPYLTAIGDLLGTVLLALAFYLLYLMSDSVTQHESTVVFTFNIYLFYLLSDSVKEPKFTLFSVKHGKLLMKY